jgi:hypothetical protein
MVGFSVVGQYLCPLQPDPCLMETTIILWNICSCKRIKDSTMETRGTGLRTTLNADNRIDGIDFWRGVALLTIFIDHAPDNVFQKITVGNFGFSDAADLFVFLSGASVALAYGSPFFGGKTAAAIRAVFRRALTLYWVQILISLLTITESRTVCVQSIHVTTFTPCSPRLTLRPKAFHALNVNTFSRGFISPSAIPLDMKPAKIAG